MCYFDFDLSNTTSIERRRAHGPVLYSLRGGREARGRAVGLDRNSRRAIPLLDVHKPVVMNPPWLAEAKGNHRCHLLAPAMSTDHSNHRIGDQ